MLKASLKAWFIAVALHTPAWAEQPLPADQIQQQEKTQIYGYQLMTPAERAEHRAKMQTLQTPKERRTYQLEHHKLMRQRAIERGVMLPDMTPDQLGPSIQR